MLPPCPSPPCRYLTNRAYFTFTATSSLLPYLTIHMQSIGLTVEEIAIIYLALPFTTFLSPPITGEYLDGGGGGRGVAT